MVYRARLSTLAMLVAGSALLAAQAPSPAPPPAASQQPTFKVQVDYVEVDTLVTDRDGNPVSDLKQEDFQVTEDGKPQTITAFSRVNIPIDRLQRPLASAAPIEPDVKTNESPFDGRIYVMVLDDMHTRFQRSERVKRAAKQFIEKNLAANDVMAVVHTAGATDASQEFTSNKRLLAAAVDRTMGRKMDSATATKLEGRMRAGGGGSYQTDPDDAERAFNARASLGVLRQISDWFAGIHGRRKTILFVSEGIDYDIENNTGFGSSGASGVVDATRDAITAATRANVSIYGIDPRGLTTLGDEDIEIAEYPDDTLVASQSSLQNELRLSQDSLRTLSTETGGFAVVNQNDFATAFDRIVQDNSSYYVLAYYPPVTDKNNNKFHKIEVRVTRPGLTVRARQGYATPKAKPADKPSKSTSAMTPEIREALDSPLPISGLALHVFAAPFKGTAPNASVLVGIEMNGHDLKMVANNPVNLSYVAVDADGKVKNGGGNVVPWTGVTPEQRARIEQTGVRLLNRLDLPPGRYQLHVAASEAGGGELGSVVYDLNVPDFYKAPFTMSGLTMTSPIASRLPTVKPDEQLRTMLPAAPVAQRTFTPNDEIALFVEVYDNAASNAHKVDITTTVTSDDAKVVFKTSEERSSSDIQGKSGGYGYSARVPLKDIAPGTYVLKVEARSRLGQGATASREVQFTIK